MDGSVRRRRHGARQPAGLKAMIVYAATVICLLLIGMPSAARAEGASATLPSLSTLRITSLESVDLTSIRRGAITGKKRTCEAAAPQICTPGEDDKVAQYGGCVCCFINGCGCMPVNICYGQRGICRGPC